MAKAKPKEATAEVQKELQDIISDKGESITLTNGKILKIRFARPDTEDKIDDIFTTYQIQKKKKGIKDEDEDLNRITNKHNRLTRRYFAKISAAILLNSFWKLRLLWWFKWRVIYYFSGWLPTDHINIMSTYKKKRMEQVYLLAMALSTEMVATWTMMTNKEAEEYRAELKSAREHLS